MEEIIFNIGAGLAFAVIVLEKGIGLIKFLWADRNKKEGDSTQNLRLALIEQKFLDFQTNHAIHQKAIEEYMRQDAEDKKKIFMVIVKLATKEGVEFF